jgi:hypothetical protein
MLQIFSAKNGMPTASCNGVNLHSSYNPEREALRFIQNAITEQPAVIIFIAGGIGYLEQSARTLFPEVRIISVLPHKSWLQKTVDRQHVWSPQSGGSLACFLERLITDREIDGLNIVAWPAGFNADPSALQFLTTVKEFVIRVKQSFESVSYFGRLWLKNALFNFLMHDNYVVLRGTKPVPVLIAASGPSLSRQLTAIRANRRAFFLIALPSSLTALRYAGIAADLIVSIDGGYYAGHHLAHCGTDTPIATSLLAARHKGRSLIFSLSSFFEKELMAGFDIMPVLWRGTVAATAIDLALKIAADNPVFLAGFDLSFDYLNQHVRPHTFDSFYDALSKRLEPLATVYQKLAWHGEKSLEAYLSWFSGQVWPANIKIIGDNTHSKLPFQNCPADTLEKLKPVDNSSCFETRSFPPLPERFKKVENILNGWITVIKETPQSALASDIFFYLAAHDFIRYKKACRLKSSEEESLLAALTAICCKKIEYFINKFSTLKPHM